MHYYLALTSKCNLLCKYCYGKTTEDFLTDEERSKYNLALPGEVNFSVDELLKFSKDDPNFSLTFYGGEPLMKIPMVKEIMDKVPAKDFMLQTNGTFLDKLGSEYVNRLNTILVSVDGTPAHTNFNRGVHIFEKIIKNLDKIKSERYKGEIIARMTVDESGDVYENVKYLYENEECPFSSIHWQMDAQFWKADYFERDFKDWADTKYNPSISKLVDWWVDKMKETGTVPMIYPFVGVFESILTGEKSPMKCGAGHSLLGIQTDGKVASCPITAGYKPFEMGDIRTSSLKDVENSEQLPDNTCNSCEIKDICGGRCLYANKTKLWGEKGFGEVCDTVFFLVDCLKAKKNEILELIEQGVIKREEFDYNKYNGCEIIP